MRFRNEWLRAHDTRTPLRVEFRLRWVGDDGYHPHVAHGVPIIEREGTGRFVGVAASVEQEESQPSVRFPRAEDEPLLFQEDDLGTPLKKAGRTDGTILQKAVARSTRF
jgi:hypothetical protein